MSDPLGLKVELVNMEKTIIEFEELTRRETGVLCYFATQSCAVGEALEPKVKKLLEEKYPKLVYAFIDMNGSPELCAALQVFVEPTILLYMEGKEYLRKSRHVGISDLDASLDRLYGMAFQ